MPKSKKVLKHSKRNQSVLKRVYKSLKNLQKSISKTVGKLFNSKRSKRSKRSRKYRK